MKDIMLLLESLRFAAHAEGVASIINDPTLAASASDQCREIVDKIRQRLNIVAQQSRRLQGQTKMFLGSSLHQQMASAFDEQEEEEEPPIEIEFSL